MEPISTNHKVNMLIEEFDKIFIADRDETLKDGNRKSLFSGCSCSVIKSSIYKAKFY